MKCYKLTDKEMKTHGDTQWAINEKRTEKGGADSQCGEGWLHAYEHPLLAVLHDPIYGNFGEAARLFEAEAGGKISRPNQLKLMCTELTLLREIPLPKITSEQRVRYAILCAIAADDACKACR